MHKTMKIGFLFFTLFLSGVIFSQKGTIKGKITDQKSEPVYNATLIVSQSDVKAKSDPDGNYELVGISVGSAKSNVEITIKASGYSDVVITVELSPNEIITKDITLSDGVKQFEEAVVIGYGTTRTKDLTGSAAVINEKNFTQGSMSTPEQLIMGKVSGLKINTNDGAPGSGSTLRLRGGTSINASNDPLIVVDGVPLDNGGIAGAANPLSLINPNDIASFVVLKDASATAIYGSRAANGVIIKKRKFRNGTIESYF